MATWKTLFPKDLLVFSYTINKAAIKRLHNESSGNPREVLQIMQRAFNIADERKYIDTKIMSKAVDADRKYRERLTSGSI